MSFASLNKTQTDEPTVGGNYEDFSARHKITTPSLSTDKTRRTDYFIVLLLILVSGNQLFYSGTYRDFIWLATALIFLTILFHRKQHLYTRKSVTYSLIFLSLFVSHAIIFSFFPVLHIIGFYVRLFIAFAALSLVKNFHKTYIRSIYAIGVLSLFFYIPDQLALIAGVKFRLYFEPVRDTLGQLLGVDERFNILLYNFQSAGEKFRNAAFFWEPGAFAGHLMLGMIFLILFKNDFTIREYNKLFLVLSLCLLTTFSTTGYLLLIYIYLLYIFEKNRRRTNIAGRFLFYYFTISCLVVLYLLSFNFDFMAEKINFLYTRAVNRELNWHVSRIGGVLYDWEYIQRHPLVGWSSHPAIKDMLYPYLHRFGSGNGLTGFAHEFGLIGLTSYLIGVYSGIRKSLKNRPKKYSLYFLMFIVLLLNGESYLHYPFFWGLIFLGEYRPLSEKKENP